MQIGTTTPIAFEVAVTPHLVIHGVLWACVIGFAGGLCPAIHAARLPVARALNTVV
jgi:putative ABC transport system permease protein